MSDDKALNKIFIYSGDGADRRGCELAANAMRNALLLDHFLIEKVDHHIFDREGWDKDLLLWVMPGGRDLPYLHQLKGAKSEKLQRWVHSGGRYLGLCAGAYFASSHVAFEMGTALEVQGARPLKFFPGVARGAYLGSGQFEYHSLKGATLANVFWQGDESQSSFCAPIFYNGGCSFEVKESHQETKVLAHYLDKPDRAPAIISCKVGLGLAILSGIHPEYETAVILAQSVAKSRRRDWMVAVESRRLKLWRALIQELLPQELVH